MSRKPNNKNKEAVSVVKRFSKLRGMRDILFDEYRYWNLVLKKANDLASVYSFNRIDTPILESAGMYERSTGKTSDVVSKEMYVFQDKSGDKIAMRPEMTPSLVRSYIEHGMFNMPQPVKMFSIGPLFRHERPQSGRYRQHTQFDVEMFGEASPVADSQLILLAYNFFKELQINIEVHINSVGCSDCRPEYVKQLISFYKERGKRSKLCPDCKKRFTTNPLRLLDCKEAACVEVRENAPQIVDSLCDSCRDHFMAVLEYMDELEIPYSLNPYLVRGLDYYTRTVFEFIPQANEELEEEGKPARRQISLGGGGRYDDLVEHMGGVKPTPACGFGIGLDRTILAIKDLNIPIKKDEENIIFIAQLGDSARRKTMVLFEELRKSGYRVKQAFSKDSLKAQLEEANRIGAVITFILGQKELAEETIILRDMDAGVQEVVDYKKIFPELEKRLGGRS